MSFGLLGFSNNSSNTFLPMLELIVPASISSTNSANCSAVNGICSGSISFSFNILAMSEFNQLHTAL